MAKPSTKSVLSLPMMFPSHIFRSYDIRGLLEEVTPELARRVAANAVRSTGVTRVVVGRDARETSPALLEAAVEGIRLAGATAIDIGACTTSLFNFSATHDPSVELGIMITASHNPSEYNGIKAIHGNGQPISGKEMQPLAEQEIVPAPQFGGYEKADAASAYLDACLSHGAPDLSGVKIVVDYGNGMGVVTVRALLKRLQADVVELYPEPDARFPNHEANPAKEETLQDLARAIIKEGAAFGIALDGDADRVAFMDETGSPVRGDQTLGLLSGELLTRVPGAPVVTTVNMSRIVEETIQKNGGITYLSKVGRTNVIQDMQKNSALLGGEFSGHFFFQEFSCLEAVDFAIVRIAQAWKTSGQTFSAFAAPMRVYAHTGEINKEVHQKEAALLAIENTFVPRATSVDRRDGVRCQFSDGSWLILRTSNTEPVVRLTVEANTESEMVTLRDEALLALSGIE